MAARRKDGGTEARVARLERRLADSMAENGALLRENERLNARVEELVAELSLAERRIRSAAVEVDRMRRKVERTLAAAAALGVELPADGAAPETAFRL